MSHLVLNQHFRNIFFPLVLNVETVQAFHIWQYLLKSSLLFSELPCIRLNHYSYTTNHTGKQFLKSTVLVLFMRILQLLSFQCCSRRSDKTGSVLYSNINQQYVR